MSDLDSTALIAIFSTPASEFSTREKAPKGSIGLPRFTYRWRWGQSWDAGPVEVCIITAYLPWIDDNMVTVTYSPTCRIVTIGGVVVHDLYVGVGLYVVEYKQDKPELPQGLDLSLQPLGKPVDRAPYRSSFF